MFICHSLVSHKHASLREGRRISSVQSLSRVGLFATPWTAARQASLSITNSQSLLKLMSIESLMPPNHLILCHLLPLPPSVFASIRVFSNESVLRIRWPKCWSFSFNIGPSNEYSGLISSKLLLLLSRFSRVRPHRRQPTRLPRPWDSQGKNTGVGCHFLL